MKCFRWEWFPSTSNFNSCSSPISFRGLKWFICAVESIWVFLSWRYATPLPSMWPHSMRGSSTIKIFAVWMRKPGWDLEDLCCENHSSGCHYCQIGKALCQLTHFYGNSCSAKLFSRFSCKISMSKSFFLANKDLRALLLAGILAEFDNVKLQERIDCRAKEKWKAKSWGKVKLRTK